MTDIDTSPEKGGSRCPFSGWDYLGRASRRCTAYGVCAWLPSAAPPALDFAQLIKVYQNSNIPNGALPKVLLACSTSTLVPNSTSYQTENFWSQ